ncbi:MAG: hypothetical protein L6R28_02565 [Planctomycetes bacterium]|nr:hypothetical protein [Planctomycetota bacterium]
MHLLKHLLLAFGAVALFTLLSEIGRFGADAPPVSAKVELAAGPAQSSPFAVPPGAEPLRVHWRLKLPDQLSAAQAGDFVFRSASDFVMYLGTEKSHYARWNGVDFSKQMAVLAARILPGNGGDLEIVSAWKADGRVTVCVRLVTPKAKANGERLGHIDGVVLDRCDLPVDFRIVESAR